MSFDDKVVADLKGELTTALETFDDYWTGGDPVLRQHYLLHSIIPIATIITSYVVFVTFLGPAIMRNRKPIQLRKLMIAYNFGLVAFYLYFLITGAFFIPELGFNLICGSLIENENPIIREVFDHGYLLYLVRLIELLDTVFLVLSKKFNMITTLHVFHHAIVPVVVWFGLRSETSGYLAVYMTVNGFVHIIMYTYYAIAALGPEYQKYLWWKKYLTTLQITQFFFITFYLIVMSAIGCVTSKFTFCVFFFLTVLFFFLFIDYYRKIYNKRGKQGQEQSNGVHKNGVPTAYRKAAKKE